MPQTTKLVSRIRKVTDPAAIDRLLTHHSGYWGIGVQVQQYTGSFWVKGSYKGEFTASLKSDITNETFATAQVQSQASPNEWVQHNYTFTPTSAAPNSNNSFYLTFDKSGVTGGSLDFTLISLFPPTYKNRPNGLRVDIASALKALNGKFLRFPGGKSDHQALQLGRADKMQVTTSKETPHPTSGSGTRPSVLSRTDLADLALGATRTPMVWV